MAGCSLHSRVKCLLFMFNMFKSRFHSLFASFYLHKPTVWCRTKRRSNHFPAADHSQMWAAVRVLFILFTVSEISWRAVSISGHLVVLHEPTFIFFKLLSPFRLLNLTSSRILSASVSLTSDKYQLCHHLMLLFVPISRSAVIRLNVWPVYLCLRRTQDSVSWLKATLTLKGESAESQKGATQRRAVDQSVLTFL